MFTLIQKPAISPRQKAAAVAVAGIVDMLQLALIPALLPGYVLDDVLDILAAVALIAICGFKWQFVVAFLLELVPFFDLLPTWTAVVILLPTTHSEGQLAANTNVRQPPYPSIEVSAVVVPPVKGEAVQENH
jgi:hypothetical protein